MQESFIAPLTILDLKDFELIMELVRKGYSFVDLLKEKNSTPQNKDMSFLNFLVYYQKKYELPNRPM
ncbi:hypothetical protein [Natranaerofaba carboxydovora]|uniref:hypothetical protein n=1 Tax=Natranaerofaba carboxydovora TaxID=2742683 RepID=UPI001F12E02C|nr:hypothetical protein [Natranaerofaba carboxydovora]UMZ72964.1 hypothetical protein ACONDI_00503 [Natranaerofaba carboxydovora]